MGRTVVALSDVHGNLPALQAVARSIPPADAVVVAGDLCLSGPHPAEVLDLLWELGWQLILGNTDRDIVRLPEDLKQRKAEQACWTRRQLGERRLQHLAQLPFSATIDGAGGETVCAVHANPLNLEDHLRPEMTDDELQPYLDGVEADLLVFGHLHIPYVRPAGRVLLVDVASVGHPKDLDLRAAYTVLEWEDGRRSVRQVRVPYDVEEAVHALRRSGMPHAEEQVQSLLKASY